MIKMLVGEKGSGKTKTMLAAVGDAVREDHGAVIFINKGDRHVYDLDYNVRLVNTEEFSCHSYDMVYGLLSGILTSNYDITHVFMDSITKIVGNSDIEELEKFIAMADELANRFNITLYMTVSMSQDNLTEGLRKYL